MQRQLTILAINDKITIHVAHKSTTTDENIGPRPLGAVEGGDFAFRNVFIKVGIFPF